VKRESVLSVRERGLLRSDKEAISPGRHRETVLVAGLREDRISIGRVGNQQSYQGGWGGRGGGGGVGGGGVGGGGCVGGCVGGGKPKNKKTMEPVALPPGAGEIREKNIGAKGPTSGGSIVDCIEHRGGGFSSRTMQTGK